MRRIVDDIPAITGLVKSTPEDFVVEEIPLYPLAGEGDHAWLWVEKVGLNTQEVVLSLAGTLGIPESLVGRAGQKDRQAVTRQYLSVPAAAVENLTDAELAREGYRILSRGLHLNKLKTGHLAGNRFELRIRGAGGQLADAEAALAILAARGVPNYFGDQRFGRHGDNAARGRALLLGKSRVRKRFERRMYISALQSELFNTWLDARIDDDLFESALTGDLLRVRSSGGVFWCDDAEADTPRVKSGELDPTGPLFGHKMRQAKGPAGPREASILEAAGLTLETFRSGRKDAQGTRRPARIHLGEPSLLREGEDLCLAFTLPKGAYATVVLAQLCGTG